MGATQTRKRWLYHLLGGTSTQIVTANSTGALVLKTTRSYGIIGKQETRSTDNTDWHARRMILTMIRKNERQVKRGKKAFLSSTSVSSAKRLLMKRDIGNAFLTTKTAYSQSIRYVTATYRAGSTTTVYKGPIFPYQAVVKPDDTYWPSVSTITDAKLWEYGAKAIARTIPTNPVSNLAVALGELKEHAPSIPGKAIFSQGSRSRAIGSEYLNVEFGIKPFISDIRKVAGTVKKTNSILSQYQRDSGRLIRRRHSFPLEVSTDVEVMSTNWPGSPALPTALYTVGSGQLTRTTKTTSLYTFAGAYTYYFDPGEDLWGRFRRNEAIANKLFGTRINVSLIYELTPWSWAVDWKSNLGSVMTNISALSNDSLVIAYAYMMVEQTIDVTYELSGLSLKGYGALGTITQTFTTKVKKRVKATPYGFGLSTADFTGRQWAILGALGLAKGPKLL